MTRCATRRLAATALLIVPLVAVAAGCPRRTYDVRLEPNDKGLQRTLTTWIDGVKRPPPDPNAKLDQPPKDELTRRLSELYPERLTTDADERQTFRGTFTDKMPADVGGSGTYETFDSPLGSAHWYVERFRGSDDFDAQLYDRRTSADRLADLIVGWFDLQLKDSPHRDAVYRTLHQDFRQELRNVTAFFLISSNKRQEPLDEEKDAPGFPLHQVPEGHPLVRVAQYCIERGYVTPGELAMLVAKEEGREADVCRLARRKLGRNLKLTEAEADKALEFLAPTPECAESWRTYLAGTPEYARLLNAWKKAKETEEKKPDPLKVVEQLVIPTLIDPALLPLGNDVRVTLKTPVRPYLTNGEYDVVELVVGWHGSLNGEGFGLPLLCTAAWSVPNEKFQAAHFGGLKLEGEKLSQFAALYRSLPAMLRAEFAKHLAALKPGEGLRGRILDFTFAAPIDPSAQAALKQLLELLTENL